MQVFSNRNDYYFLILSGTLYDIERKYAYKIFAGENDYNHFFFLSRTLFGTHRNLHIISSSTNIYIIVPSLAIHLCLALTKSLYVILLFK